MAEQQASRVQAGSAVLDIGDDVGALIIYTRSDLHGREIEVSPRGYEVFRVHTAVLERRVQGRPLHAALFAALPAGDYVVWCDAARANEATISGGQVAELDWRDLAVSLPPRAMGYDDEPRAVRGLGRPSIAPALLPPRYRNGKPVSSAPMGAAPLRYGDDGQVAWDQMWAGFCDLALAGGPPHRDTVLGPAKPEAVLAAPEDYRRVVAEIERGLRLVTDLAVERCPMPGWIGLRCRDDAMAEWLQMAVEAENVAVRREGPVLFLPAGPAFLLEREIKNVVTVVAKTHHYWMEHRAG